MESASPRRIAVSRGLGLRGGSGRRALAPSGPTTSAGLSAANRISSSGRRDIARVHDASARLNGSLAVSGLAPGLRLLVGLTSMVGILGSCRNLEAGKSGAAVISFRDIGRVGRRPQGAAARSGSCKPISLPVAHVVAWQNGPSCNVRTKGEAYSALENAIALAKAPCRALTEGAAVRIDRGSV